MRKNLMEYIFAETKHLHTCAVIRNYLDGAVADYESGDTEALEMIMDCIYVLDEFNDSSALDYLERIKKVNEQDNQKTL